MIHISLLALALMFSVSVRTPKMEIHPLDYEIATGLEMGNERELEIWSWYERENGEIWTGVDGKGRYKMLLWPLEWSGGFQNRQAQSILRGDLGLNLVYQHGRLGVKQTWDHYLPATALHIGFISKYLELGSNVYKEGIESAYAKAQYPVKMDFLTISPTFNYSIDRQDKRFVHGKVVFKIWKDKE